jgi:hypothetical protein
MKKLPHYSDEIQQLGEMLLAIAVVIIGVVVMVIAVW